MPADRFDPTVPPPQPASLNRALERNIAALRERYERDTRKAALHERLADAVTRFTGSIRFVYLHLLLFGFWIAANLGWFGRGLVWDASFVVLAMVASVEAIFLSTFVLISQNRMAAENERRANLDLQINLLAEHEVTKLIALTSAIAERLGVEPPAREEIEELERDVAPEAVLDALEREPGR
jgi:uncharacterized membrane protein